MATGAAPADAADVGRGAYLFAAGGCAGCHTDTKNNGPLLAGGRELKTPFGSFYGPNITAHPTAGIGSWSDADFVRAVRQGRRPDGAHYFPVFPYTSFTKIGDADLLDLKAYIFSLPISDKPSRPHDIGFPFNLRFLQFGWKLLYFTPGEFKPDPAKTVAVNRGAYLAQALGHCVECHSPRNPLGGLDRSMLFAGDRNPPGGGKIPNITSDPETGIGKWSDGDLDDLLGSGMTPDGDSVGGEMGEVVKNSTSKLTAEDRKALIAFLRQLPPVVNRVRTGAP
ncbi:MAG: cytochrome c [Proteobacteria bacterium]|nr:cytochrome c [Pseudomonadota bacterium]